MSCLTGGRLVSNSRKAAQAGVIDVYSPENRLFSTIFQLYSTCENKIEYGFVLL